jgi:hypothetical protein
VSDQEQAHCNKCLGDRNHSIIFSEKKDWDSEIDEYGNSCYGGEIWSLLRCLGCEDTRLCHRYWHSEDMDSDGTPNTYTKFYPPTQIRNKPEWAFLYLTKLSGRNEIRDLIDEIYLAFAAGALRLTVMGMRALVEKIMIEKVGDKGSFVQNTKAFFEAGYVAKIQQDLFDKILIEAGHATMHRAWQPDPEDIATLLDILEGIMRTIYVDPHKAKRVEIPRRR